MTNQEAAEIIEDKMKIHKNSGRQETRKLDSDFIRNYHACKGCHYEYFPKHFENCLFCARNYQDLYTTRGKMNKKGGSKYKGGKE